jgi:osmotically-inducible protein OsmY
MRRTSFKASVMAMSLAALAALPAMAAAPPDGLITSKAKLSLWTTGGLRSASVHVDTSDGVVTLHGKVSGDDQKVAAEKAAGEIAGVRGVTNLLQVVPAARQGLVARSDKETRALVQRVLRYDPALKDSAITVKSVDNGVVLLTGEASSLSDRLWAVGLVDRTPGVRGVVSEIKGPDQFGAEERVTLSNPPASQGKRSSASDMRTSAEVKLRLLSTVELPSIEINVDTTDGVVILFGIVPSTEAKQAAGVEAGKVANVARVQNQLEVVAASEKTRVEAKDADITRDLLTGFTDHPDLQNVEATVRNGTVQLTGTVSSGWSAVTALRVVRQVPGVRGVESQLRVEEKAETTRR